MKTNRTTSERSSSRQSFRDAANASLALDVHARMVIEGRAQPVPQPRNLRA